MFFNFLAWLDGSVVSILDWFIGLVSGGNSLRPDCSRPIRTPGGLHDI
jgi:hypothetical protein